MLGGARRCASVFMRRQGVLCVLFGAARAFIFLTPRRRGVVLSVQVVYWGMTQATHPRLGTDALARAKFPLRMGKAGR